MRVLIVYESMFGSTRQIAEAIGAGLTTEADGVALGVVDAPTSLDGYDLVVVGGPTHAWSMSRPSTRGSTPLRVERSDSDLVLEPGADTGPGVREWLQSVSHGTAKAAAFDTRLNSRALLTGRASKRIARQLSRLGLSQIVPPESFLVDKKSHLVSGELDRARSWGANLVAAVDRTRAVRS